MQLEALGRALKAKLPSPFCRDPYHRRQRRFKRGTPNPYKAAMNALTSDIIKAQQAVERALRNAGHTWRDLEKVIRDDHKNKWSRMPVAIRKLLSEEQIKAIA